VWPVGCRPAPLLTGFGLPAPYLVDGPPLAGISALGPASFADHAVESIEWVQSLNAAALAELPGGDLDAAFLATRRGRTQLAATLATLGDAEEAGELDSATASAAGSEVFFAKLLITGARTILVKPAPSVQAQEYAAAKLALADEKLVSALELLAP